MFKILDCTLRDGGYYNDWNFSTEVTKSYLESMQAAGVDIVELGLRSLINKGFKGASAFTTDDYLNSLSIPRDLEVAVMVNASELLNSESVDSVLQELFPIDADHSRVDIVRIACHVHEFEMALPASIWLTQKGFKVGFNLMQVADRTPQEIEVLAQYAEKYPIEVLYFADSMGSMCPNQTTKIISSLSKFWSGNLGIHTHDNKGLALSNSLAAIENGVTWIDATVTGMGRGPGNARTEELIIEAEELRSNKINIVPLMNLIESFFQPLKNKCGWGTNPYYYLAGKHGIHPTYIQEMLSDSRYSHEDIVAAIEHLKLEGGKKYSSNTLSATRDFYAGTADGSWSPITLMKDKPVLLLGAGPGAAEHRHAIEKFVEKQKPVVIALNTQSSISQNLIDLRVACHPVRLAADCHLYKSLPQPLVTPLSMLPDDISSLLNNNMVYDFGISITPKQFGYFPTHANLPNSLVISYALAIATIGQSNKIFLAGFDGFGAGDARTEEMQSVLDLYVSSNNSLKIESITPTEYRVDSCSVYALMDRL